MAKVGPEPNLTAYEYIILYTHKGDHFDTCVLTFFVLEYEFWNTGTDVGFRSFRMFVLAGIGAQNAANNRPTSVFTRRSSLGKLVRGEK